MLRLCLRLCLRLHARDGQKSTLAEAKGALGVLHRRAAEQGRSGEGRYEDARALAGLAGAIADDDPANARRHADRALASSGR